MSFKELFSGRQTLGKLWHDFIHRVSNRNSTLVSIRFTSLLDSNKTCISNTKVIYFLTRDVLLYKHKKFMQNASSMFRR